MSWLWCGCVCFRYTIYGTDHDDGGVSLHVGTIMAALGIASTWFLLRHDLSTKGLDIDPVVASLLARDTAAEEQRQQRGSFKGRLAKLK